LIGNYNIYFLLYSIVDSHNGRFTHYPTDLLEHMMQPWTQESSLREKERQTAGLQRIDGWRDIQRT
jgi:hypothetical protein